MRLSDKMIRFGVGLSLMSGIFSALPASAAGPFTYYRPPMVREKTFELPAHITQFSERDSAKRLEAMRAKIEFFQVQDRTMADSFVTRSAEFKIEKAEAEKFSKDFKRMSDELSTILADKTRAPEAVYKDAVAKLRERETLYDSFLNEKVKIEFDVRRSTRPGESVGDWGGNVAFGKKPAAGTAGRGQAEGTAGGKADHEGGTAAPVNTRVANAGETATKDKAITEFWGDYSPAKGCTGFCFSLINALGGGTAGGQVAAKVDGLVKMWTNNGNVEAAENFVNRLKSVVEFVNKTKDPAQKRELTAILSEMLKSRGITAESFDEMEGFAKGGDIAAIQGMHRMSVVLSNLREHFEKNIEKAPKEGTPAYDAWVARRDAWAGAKLKDWVDYGEEFRTSVAKGSAVGKAQWDKWMEGKTEHDLMAEGAEKRPDSELQKALGGSCGGWMRMGKTT